MVSIPVIIQGEPAASVKVSDFKVEIASAPAAVASITPLAAEHLQYVLLNDQSGKSYWPGGTEQQADVAAQFLKQVVAPGTDVGSLVNFGDDVFLDVVNETDPRRIAAHLTRHGVGATRMFDAVVAGAKWLQKQTLKANSRKIMLLFSDGDDNGSRTTLQQAVETLQAARIPIFVIAPSSIETKKQGQVLRQLSGETGGIAYFLPRKTKQIDFEFIKHDLAQSFLVNVNCLRLRKYYP